MLSAVIDDFIRDINSAILSGFSARQLQDEPSQVLQTVPPGRFFIGIPIPAYGSIICEQKWWIFRAYRTHQLKNAGIPTFFIRLIFPD